ncbi:hypothetical protein HS088_TW19G00688 [Tripterygium wilfordii]|uniref:Pectinesterase inhibitor domain-containing protein n=1 Tax=Tripterygium wilfordii TaxID=458696 RepID=A0A7J7CA88_TRIWF|nr:21 kDa protein-like [Tripterygium wilfordii]KAF5731084.1 hypothetical protein HS088_TW19G00688 [Tripterygium wilfordii]
MARAALLLLVIVILTIAGTAQPSSRSPVKSDAASFIKESCGATQYPAVCVRYLSVYAKAIKQSPGQLAQVALSVSLAKAQTIKTNVSRMKYLRGLKARELAAIKDCAEEMDDMVDRLTKSAQELKLMGRARGQDFVWHASNAQTWTSAALTDANTCLDGFSGRAFDGRVKASITVQVTNVIQVTSNALALVNKYGSIP